MEGRRGPRWPILSRLGRRRLAFAGLALVALAVAGGLAWRGGGLRFRLTNRTAAPLVNVRIDFPGGCLVFDEVKPGASARATIRPAPGGGRDLPVVVTFAHNGRESRPFCVRYDLAWPRGRDVDYVAQESSAAGLYLEATTVAWREFKPRALLGLLASPTRGWTGVFLRRNHSQIAIVIGRPRDYAREALDWLEITGLVALRALHDPIDGARIVQLLVRDRLPRRDRKGHGPARELRLPFVEREIDSYPGAGFNYRLGLWDWPGDEL